MWMDLYNLIHGSLGMHFWDLPALLAGVLILAEFFVHSRKEKEQEKKCDEERTERLKAMQKEAAGTH